MRLINADPPDYEVEVFFDGACPLCRREIGWLRWLDRKRRIRFTDIAAPEFDIESLVGDFASPEELPAQAGESPTATMVKSATTAAGLYDQFMAEIHGRLPDGQWIRGVEVFRRLYAAVGFGWLVAVTRWPGIKQALNLSYIVFARNRLRWTGRCNEACQIGKP